MDTSSDTKVTILGKPVSQEVTIESHVVLRLMTLAEAEALRTILGLSHMIPAEAYDSRGLNQEKIEDSIVPVYRRLEDSFGGFHDFSEGD